MVFYISHDRGLERAGRVFFLGGGEVWYISVLYNWCHDWARSVRSLQRGRTTIKANVDVLSTNGDRP